MARPTPAVFTDILALDALDALERRQVKERDNAGGKR